MYTRMLYKMYSMSIFIALAGLIAWIILGIYIPKNMTGHAYFSKLVDGSTMLSGWVLLVALVIATFVAMYQTYILWQWKKGNIDCCFNCGGITIQKHGRFGNYSKCLACGKNESN